ncbi:flagellar biosynthesis anti-sigma factor FlgM [Paenibacillus campi]|uniref:flagellar biosynthesis anti-sigma factor FlgM n=1 Tax=Paenibacillus campi TaxID=3106031 RepID=UPI002AFEE5BA|nr:MULTISPECIES: flagellar biosynthesis anti-sigma factor FlgM [unclassified Paenibacillus]
MKINDTQRVGAVNPYQRTNEAKAAAGEKRATRKDEVSISPEAMEMLQANTAQASADAERAQKIQSLKEQVAGGTYKVDAGALADKLLPFLKGTGN